MSSSATPVAADAADVRRQRILDTVLAMLLETPATHLQMKDVAHGSAVALATLYRQFPAKDRMLAAALARWNEQMSQRFQAKRDGPGGDPHQRVRNLYRGQLLAYRSRPHYARLEVELHTLIDAEVIASLDERATANREVLRRTVPELSAEAVRVAAMVIGSTMFNAMALWTTGRISFAQAMRNTEDAVTLCVPPP